MIGEAQRPKRGFFDSLSLAWKIVAGSVRLLLRYPVLIVPMAPVFALVLAVSLSLSTVDTWAEVWMMLAVIYVVAATIMAAFGVTAQMLKQLHEGAQPSLLAAIGSPAMRQMLPRILGLAAVWYGIVFILVVIETLIRALLDRIDERLGDTVVNAIFGPISDILRMFVFMMVTIMTFEDVGLRPAFHRLKMVVKGNVVTAIGGFTLTGLVTGLILMGELGVYYLWGYLFGTRPALLLFVLVMAVGWLFSMYLEQMFLTGLYLYYKVPESPVVTFLLGEMIGKELPTRKPVVTGVSGRLQGSTPT